MEVIAIILPIALVMGGASLWVFIRCVRTGQFDDLDTPPLRMLADDAEQRFVPTKKPRG